MSVDFHIAKPGEMKFVPCLHYPWDSKLKSLPGHQNVGKQTVLDNSCGEENRIKCLGIVQDKERKWPQ